MVLFALLLIGNLITIPQFVSLGNLPGTLAVAAPFVIAAIATTPAILVGGGGIDLSVGPLLGFVNVLLIQEFIPRHLDGPLTAVPLLFLIGAGAGLVNGLLVTLVRLQPIVATLGTYLVLTGLSLEMMPQPEGQAPHWITQFGGSVVGIPGSVILVGAPMVVWALLQRTAFYRAMMAVGGDERAAFSAGVDLIVTRLGAYMIGGIFAAVAGLALTALIESGDPNIGPTYTLVAIAAVALGGTSLAGGRGGIIGSIFGALSIYLIQNLLSAVHVSALWLQVAYGAILVFAVVVNAEIRVLVRRRAAARLNA
jgi:ribose transport system permease protein